VDREDQEGQVAHLQAVLEDLVRKAVRQMRRLLAVRRAPEAHHPAAPTWREDLEITVDLVDQEDFDRPEDGVWGALVGHLGARP